MSGLSATRKGNRGYFLTSRAFPGVCGFEGTLLIRGFADTMQALSADQGETVAQPVASASFSVFATASCPAMSKSYVVRHGRMKMLGEYVTVHGGGSEPSRGARVVIRTERGTEIGELLAPATSRTSTFLGHPPKGEILRIATPHDLENETKLVDARDEGIKVCREAIARRRLQMDLVDVEAILGGERLVFYYLSEKRIDFRELVKDLARALRTRIEMRQIGVRDEAKLLADYGDCGKPVCCNTHLSRMPPVSMRMAKLQKSTLDPSKISGRCGRLKCCLRYEFDTYQALERELPSVGSKIATRLGTGRVVAQEILARKVVVEFEDRRRTIVNADDILGVEVAAPKPKSIKEKRRSKHGHDEFEDDEGNSESDVDNENVGPDR